MTAVDTLFATFAKPFLLCSNRFANPTPKMANAIFGSPARNPKTDSKSGIEKVKNGIQKYTVEREKEMCGMLLLLTSGFTQAGVYARRQFCADIQVCSPPEPL